MANAIITQVGAEGFERVTTSHAKVTQLGAETFAPSSMHAKVTQLGAEVFSLPLVVPPTKVPPKSGQGHHGSPQGKKAFNTSLWVAWSEVNTFGNG